MHLSLEYSKFHKGVQTQDIFTQQGRKDKYRGKDLLYRKPSKFFFLLCIWTASLSLLSKQPESCRQPLRSKKNKWSGQRGLKTANKKQAQEGNCLKTECSEIPMWIDRSKFFHHIYNLISLSASHFTHVKYKKFHHRRYCYI